MPIQRNDKDSNYFSALKKEAEKVVFLEELITQTTQDDSGEFNSVKAEAFLELGLIMSYRQEFVKSIKFLEKAQKNYSILKNIPQVALCLAELSWVYYNHKPENLIRSLTLLNDAKYLLENHESKEIEAKILHYYGLISYREKRYGEAIKYLKRAYRLAPKYSLEVAKIEDSLALHYSRIGDFQVSIRYLQSSLRKKTTLKNCRERSITEQILGRIYLRLEDYEHAKDYLESAIEAARTLGGSKRLCRLYCELAKVYIHIGDSDQAKLACTNSVEIAQKYLDDVAYAFAMLEYANVVFIKKESEGMLDVIETEIIPIFQKISSLRGLAFTKRIQAKYLHKQGDTKLALEIMHESMELFKDISFSIEIAKSHLEISRLYKSLGEDRLALSSIRESLRIAEEEGHYLLLEAIEEELETISEDEWLNVVEKRANKEKIYQEDKTLLEALSTLSVTSATNIPELKDPLLSLLRVGQAMAAETDLNRLLITITEETKQALNTDRATVFLLDRERNELWSKVASGMGQQEIRFPAHMGLAGYVSLNGEIVNIKDAYNDPRFNKEIDKQTGYRTKSVLCVPMRNLNHQIIGVFQVINKLDGGFFTQKDEALLVSIASSACIAIENATLFKRQAQLYIEQKKSYDSFINTLAFAIDAKDKITAGHSTRVTQYTIAIAMQMNLPQEDIEVLEYAALLHDFGKIGIQDRILCKEGILTEEEYEEIKRHAYLTKFILEKMYFEERFRQIPEIASSHHEKYNGTGYFRGAKGDEIPLGGRIMAVADVFDAITSKRHYRDRMPMGKALDIIEKDAGSHFDPRIVNIFFDIPMNSILKILISSDHDHLNETELELFNRYNMKDLHILIKQDHEKLSEEEILVLERFQYHYDRKKQSESVN